LLEEALDQGAVATQEDLARALQITTRTIQRDFATLKSQGIYLPARGAVRGIGRGQTHKAEILRRWLHGESYDQISQHTHHKVSSVHRYVQLFVRIHDLIWRGIPLGQIAQVLQISEYLVKAYLEVWKDNAIPENQERLNNELERLSRRVEEKKGGVQ
jgi:hypothetical protein